MTMPIDPKLYREAYAQLDRWNEAEQIERARQDRKLSPSERWQHYEALWMLCIELAGPPNELYLRLRYLDWLEYYLKLQQFELWKLRNATRTEESVT